MRGSSSPRLRTSWCARGARVTGGDAPRTFAAALCVLSCKKKSNNHGYLSTPGIYAAAQVEGWKRVTGAVHAKGGHIFLQLWHQGRTGQADLSGGPDGIVSASAIDGWLNGYGKPSPAPREATAADLATIVAAYATGAANAIAAGFDGVEVHAANGYLLNQFICSGSNTRTDAYGGSPENRARLLREVVAACAAAVGPERVGVRISPASDWQGMSDADPVATWTQVARDLAAAGPLAYLHVIEPRDSGFGAPSDARTVALTSAWFRAQGFTQPVISAGGYTDVAIAEAGVEGGADGIAFGRLYIANPDLVARIRRVAAGVPTTFNKWDRTTFYGGGAPGYTTGYPLLEEGEAAAGPSA